MVSTASRTAETAAVAQQVGGIPAALVATREAAVALEAAAASTAAMAVTVVVVRRAVAAAVRARAHAARVVVAARAQARAEVKMTSRTSVRNFGSDVASTQTQTFREFLAPQRLCICISEAPPGYDKTRVTIARQCTHTITRAVSGVRRQNIKEH